MTAAKEAAQCARAASGNEAMSALLAIQAALKVPKGQRNTFGGFDYRSKEDILEAAKPLAHELGCVLLVDDDVRDLPNGWVYMVATVTLRHVESGTEVSAHGFAREPAAKKGMDESQVTGTAASYAGKRALGNLLAIDDTADADADGQQAQQEGVLWVCPAGCGYSYLDGTGTDYTGSPCPQCGKSQLTRAQK